MKFKSSVIYTALLVAVCSFTTIASAFEAPSDAQIKKMLANRELVTDMFNGATAQQAADALIRVIDAIEASTLNETQKVYNIGYYTARVTKMMGDKAMDFATALLPLVSAERNLTVLSALSIGGAGDSDFIAGLNDLIDAENSDQKLAIDHPEVQLGDVVYELLVSDLQGKVTLAPVARVYVGQEGN